MNHDRIVRKHSLGSKTGSLLVKLMRRRKLNRLEVCPLLALLTIPRYQLLARMGYYYGRQRDGLSKR
jgi:hypothetical protein